MAPAPSSNSSPIEKDGISLLTKGKEKVASIFERKESTKYSVVEDLDESPKVEEYSLSKPEMEVNSFTSPKMTFQHGLFVVLCTALAILAGASIGPVFKYMEVNGIGPCLAASWRCQCMLVFLIPMGIVEALASKKNKVDWFGYKPDLQFQVFVHIIFSGVAWSGNLLFWIVGLQYTTTFKASIVSTSHPILLVIYMRMFGMPVSWLEIVGVLVSFGGMILSSFKELMNSTSENGNHRMEAFGLFLCLLAAASELVVLFNRIITKKYVPVMQYTASTTVVVTVMGSVASMILEGSELFCTHENCIFGWVSKKWLLTILVFGLWVGVACIAGFNYCMQYISPLIFSCLGLFDPAITAVLSWAIGVEPLPNIVTWIGGFVVMGGVGFITLGEHWRKEQEDADHKGEEVAENDEETGSSSGNEKDGDGADISPLQSSPCSVAATPTIHEAGKKTGGYSILATDNMDEKSLNTDEEPGIELKTTSRHVEMEVTA